MKDELDPLRVLGALVVGSLAQNLLEHSEELATLVAAARVELHDAEETQEQFELWQRIGRPWVQFSWPGEHAE